MSWCVIVPKKEDRKIARPKHARKFKLSSCQDVWPKYARALQHVFFFLYVFSQQLVFLHNQIVY